MKSNLVLTPVTDKNGVVTKRWTKPVDHSLKMVSFPAPKAAIHDRKLLLERLAEVNKESLYGRDRKTYDGLQEDTLALLIREHNREPMRGSIINYWLGRNAGNEPLIRELNTYAYVFERGTDSDFIESAMKDLRNYKDLPIMDDYSKADPDLREFIAGLLKVTEALYSDIWNNGYEGDEEPVTIVYENPTNVPTMVDDPALQQLIFDHPDKVHHIRKVIMDRGSKDPEVIREVVTSDAVALGEGAL